MTVASILKGKGYAVTTGKPSMTVAEIAHSLAEKRIGALLVLDPAGKLLGIVSERDIVRALAEHGAHALDMPAEALMTRAVQTATPQTTVAEAMEVMTVGRFRHLPVLDQGALVGLISIGDVVKARIMQQDHEVDSLKAYVAGA
jgi:CBS domain-containing protein